MCTRAGDGALLVLVGLADVEHDGAGLLAQLVGGRRCRPRGSRPWSAASRSRNVAMVPSLGNDAPGSRPGPEPRGSVATRGETLPSGSTIPPRRRRGRPHRLAQPGPATSAHAVAVPSPRTGRAAVEQDEVGPGQRRRSRCHAAVDRTTGWSAGARSRTRFGFSWSSPRVTMTSSVPVARADRPRPRSANASQNREHVVHPVVRNGEQGRRGRSRPARPATGSPVGGEAPTRASQACSRSPPGARRPTAAVVAPSSVERERRPTRPRAGAEPVGDAP